MTIKITSRDILCRAVYKELMAITESAIRDAHGEPVVQLAPSEITSSVYDEVVAQAEAQADLDSEMLGSEG